MANAWIDGKLTVTMGEKMATFRLYERTHKMGLTKMRELSQWLQVEVNKASLKENTFGDD